MMLASTSTRSGCDAICRLLVALVVLLSGCES
jgi:hypothetical protein